MSVVPLSLDDVVPPSCRGGAVTIGNFDGVHRGHQALVAETQRQARTLPGPAVAVTFDPHPLQLLRPEAFLPVLSTLEHRGAWLHQAGADHVLVLQTSPAWLRLSARDFFERIVVAGFEARRVVEGFNFFFGQGREGNVETMQRFCREAGRPLTVLAPIEWEDKPVSSSRVRKELVAGDVATAAILLGRPYRLSGLVSTGHRRGQTLGFPTANLESVQTIVPGNGVYAVRALVGDQAWPAAANVGPNPTFGEQERKIEVHLIGFQGDLYGQTLHVDFLRKLRDVRGFAGPADLEEQIRRDLQTAVQATREIAAGPAVSGE